MSLLQLLLCLLLHAVRSLQTLRRTITRSEYQPPPALFRAEGAPPLMIASFNGDTGVMVGRVQGSSNTLFPQNLSAQIQANFNYDYGSMPLR